MKITDVEIAIQDISTEHGSLTEWIINQFKHDTRQTKQAQANNALK
jgi:hypothetical protein